MRFSRRTFLRSVSAAAVTLTLDDIVAYAAPLQNIPSSSGRNPLQSNATRPLGVTFTDIAGEAGLDAKTIFGGETDHKYILETTGCGVAFFDYDHDGWLDIFLMNGWRLEGFPDGDAPTCHLFRNNRDGTFTDVTREAGLLASGWGQGVCVGDYDNDGNDDLFLTFYGKHILFHNNGDGTFTDVTRDAGLEIEPPRWSTGCAFVDTDRNGHLDLFVASYIDLDLKTAPLPDSGECLYRGEMIVCGPAGLEGGKNMLYRNNGDGTFTDVSEERGITQADGTYGLGVVTADFNDNGWPDIYVANDTSSSVLYENQGDGTFVDVGILAGVGLSPEGKEQAGMGVAVADYDRDGLLDIVKTNFEGETDSLYRNLGGGAFEDATYAAGLGANSRFLSWGTGFFDMDNDGWPDLLICSGHVFLVASQLRGEQGYAQPKTLYRNLRDGRFEDVTELAGEGITVPVPARGCAFGDFDNDGDVDFVVNPINAMPQLIRSDHSGPENKKNNWIKIRTIGVESNRSGIGAKIRCVTETGGDEPFVQIDEVRSGGGFLSQNDLRVHFGLGKADRVLRIEIRWPSGAVETLNDLAPNQLIVVKEGKGVVATDSFGAD